MQPIAQPRVGGLMNIIRVCMLRSVSFIILPDDDNHFLVIFGGTCRYACSTLKLPMYRCLCSINNFNYVVFYM
jgi:hypothetical protein